MRALTADRPGRWSLRSWPDPGEDDQVVVASRAAGICATDVHILDGSLPAPRFPHVLGHEGAGVVTYVPPGTGRLRVGDRVALYSPIVCGRCRSCRAGREEVCTAPGGQLGFSLDGTFRDAWSAPADNLFLLAASVSFTSGALMGCAGMTAVHAVRLSGLDAGDTVVVTGVGGLGLMLIQLAQARGARVVAIADAPAKAALARDAGAADVLLLDTAGFAPLSGALRQLTAGAGVDHYFDAVGTAESLDLGIGSAAPCGTVVVLTGSDEKIMVEPRRLLRGQIRLIGSLAGSRRDFAAALALAERGLLRPHIDQELTLANAPSGLDRVRTRQALGRNVIVW